MKDVSLRPKKQLMNLFEAVQRMENSPEANRNAIISKAMILASGSSKIDWQSLSKITIEENFDKEIPNHIVLKVDEECFLKIKEQIKFAFGAEKVTIPYVVKLLLTLYYVHLSQQAEDAQKKVHIKQTFAFDLKVDTVVLKNEFEQSIYSGKKKLLNLCKILLMKNPDLYEQLLSQCKHDLKVYTDFFEPNKYFAYEMGEQNPTLIYLTKVVAGFLILRIGSVSGIDEARRILDEIVLKMEADLQVFGQPFDNKVDATYYKNVYAKMMGGRI